MKPHSLFWPLSASLVSFATGVGISWAYLSGLPIAVIDTPLSFGLYSLAGLVPFLFGCTITIKILTRFELAFPEGEAWQSREPSHWFRLGAAISVFAGGAACSIAICSRIGHGQLDGRLRDIVLIVAMAVLPIYIATRIAWWVVPHMRELSYARSSNIRLWPTIAAGALLLDGLVVTYLYYAEPSFPGGYVVWVVALMDFLPGVLPAIWGVYVVKFLVDFDQLGSLFRRLPFITAAKRFLVGLAGSAMLVALYLATSWETLAQQDWRSVYFVSVFLAIPAAIGLWAGARVMKKAEHAS